MAFQDVDFDLDEIDASPIVVMAANKKKISAKPTVDYEIDNYIESYSCCPPTLFIPIVTVLEVSTGSLGITCAYTFCTCMFRLRSIFSHDFKFSCLNSECVHVSVFQLIIFIVYAVQDDKVTATEGGAPLDSPLIFNPSRRYEAWRFITYMLVHSGYAL